MNKEALAILTLVLYAITRPRQNNNVTLDRSVLESGIVPDFITRNS